MSRKQKSDVSQFLTEEPQPPVKKCLTCARRDILPHIEEFAKLLREGRTSASWSFFYTRFLVAKHNYTPGYSALMNHVRRCMKQ